MPRTAAAPFTPPDLAGKTIIMVEDDNDTREFFANVLERTGAQIHLAADGLEALSEIQRIAADNRPDLIILDFMLSGVNGSDIIARLKSRAELKDIPLLVITAYPECEELQELPVLQKPAKVSDIYEKIKTVMGI